MLRHTAFTVITEAIRGDVLIASERRVTSMKNHFLPLTIDKHRSDRVSINACVL